ncbi:phosphate ABC transporter permease [Burkholderia sp. MSMB0856]|uniref:HPr family phosphocarrier protein n=1 Tax=Burkholderia sp. MSMB0856 TaxID=1637869 RepID=UPI0008557C43|nr:HPr family phosphocarrier protein [Burkholderia sp. MSMB0856]AOJ90796.1 phosphate ABC transporter permease [Burkholderia sp. MSMB0856]
MATVVHFEKGSAWSRDGANSVLDVLVDTARRLDSVILLIANGRRGNAKDGMAVSSLQVRRCMSAQVLSCICKRLRLAGL